MRSRHAIYACLVLALWNARQPIPDAVQYDALTSAVELRRVHAEPSDMQKPLKGLLEALVIALTLGLALGAIAFAFWEWAASGFAI